MAVVAISICASLVLGAVFGLASVKLAGVFGRIGASSATVESEPKVAAPV